MVGGAVVLVAILASVLGSDEPPVETVMITMPPQGATTTTSPTVAEGPQVAPIDGCTLLADDDIEEALGLIADDGELQVERADDIRDPGSLPMGDGDRRDR